MNFTKETLLASLNQVGGSTSKKECPHLAFKPNNNKCANCDKHVSNFDKLETPFHFRCIDRNLTHEAMKRLRGNYSGNLLKCKKLHLVLDLDETLIHAVDKPKNRKNSKSGDVYEFLNGTKLLKLRPGARDFLDKAAQLYDLSIYTMADESYAREVAKILESDKVRFSRVVCKTDYKMDRKSLDIVLYDKRVVLIVDDTVDVWDAKARGNLIKIQKYKFFPNEVDGDDQELERVFGVLKAVHTKFFAKRQENSNDTKDLLEKIMMVDE